MVKLLSVLSSRYNVAPPVPFIMSVLLLAVTVVDVMSTFPETVQVLFPIVRNSTPGWSLLPVFTRLPATVTVGLLLEAVSVTS